MKDYKGAIAAQQVVVERFPESPRAPDALLNIAASQVELKDTARARTALTKILSDYPGTEAAKVADERLKVLGRK
jgi:TolA-binding protein